jgi:hypothetical protein
MKEVLIEVRIKGDKGVNRANGIKEGPKVYL